MTRRQTAIPGTPTLVDGPRPVAVEEGAPSRPPCAGVAVALMEEIAETHAGATLFLATSERRADEIVIALGALSDPATTEVLLLPPWDCLPYDRASPSREIMGRRMAALARMSVEPDRRRIVVSSPAGLMQRVPPPEATATVFELTAGERLDREALNAFARAVGYQEDERVDEPGEIAFLGEVIDIFPANGARPVRLLLDPDDRLSEIKQFDPVSQRTDDALDRLTLGPASERIMAADAERLDGEEHDLAAHYPALASPLDNLAGSDVFAEPGVLDRCRQFVAQVADAHSSAVSFAEADRAPVPPPDRLYLALEDLPPLRSLEPALTTIRPVPLFAQEGRPGAALRAFVAARREAGLRIVFAALDHERRALSRVLNRQVDGAPAVVSTWDEALVQDPGTWMHLDADFDAGFEDETRGIVVLTPSDVAGGRLARRRSGTSELLAEPELRVGDVVIHEDHGLGVLETLERVTTDGVERDVLRLAYHGGASVLAPVEDIGRIWRYSSEPAAVALDRLNGKAWPKRRAEVSAQIDATAARLVELARARDTIDAPVLAPPRPEFARFVARFPFAESVDQTLAIEATLADLASGRPMNRLVCGDVGFGKTEVALRAAAASALSGRQVLIAAPTTVLARQHYDTFRRRFADTSVEVALLSRTVEPKEASRVKAGLADGSIRVVVGTQGLGQPSVVFKDLALTILDEEHRFGAQLKQDLAARAPHLLALTATPIPRTLQSALVGIQDVSVIASPPARRRPIRTFLSEFDSASVRSALVLERRRAGQSFVVVPRIEDIEPMRETLGDLVPELSTVVVHGKLDTAAVDEAMMGFAEGRGDVLLATNIIENGLDVPRANTILICRPDRFGLAQLHQLRGRVGRGRAQGVAYLLNDPGIEMAEATRARLATLEALDRLGSGFAVSARDLDLRGGGTLVGEDQAGHENLIGASLYRTVLQRALRAARGQIDLGGTPPQINVVAGSIPEDYVPDATVRINLYARLARLETVEEIDEVAAEIDDRFGPPPEGVDVLLAHARLHALARSAGVIKIVSGPKATAMTVHPSRVGDLGESPLPAGGEWCGERILLATSDGRTHDTAWVESVLSKLAA